MARLFDTQAIDFDEKFGAFLARRRGEEIGRETEIGAIIAAVRADGFAALARYTASFDRFDLTLQNARVSAAEIDSAMAACDPALIAALELASARIRNYHERARPKDHQFVDDAGVMLGWRWTPIDAVGLYVPGGRAAYPSTVLMNAVPARVAGVRRLAMTTPAPYGAISPAVLAAARIAGVDEIWRLGGAQAIAALAYGAGPIASVDKIVGPGNSYVAGAKKRVFGQVGIDAVAGPSEVVILADRGNRPEILAADLLAQAEHDPEAQSILISDDSDLLARTAEEAAAQIPYSGPGAERSWSDWGALVLVRDLAGEGPGLVDRLAPEHVQLACAEAEAIAERIRHAGAIFLGRAAAEALGDYVTGANHVLPTGRTARFSSGLTTADFMKRISIQNINAKGLAAIGPAAAILADAEGLPAHARSIRLRLRDLDDLDPVS